MTKENSRRVELYSIHTNPFKSFEFCVAGRDHFVRFVYFLFSKCTQKHKIQVIKLLRYLDVV